MWTKWISLHRSYGFPRAAEECRVYLENNGVRVRLKLKRNKRATVLYILQVPKESHRRAKELLAQFKKTLA
ncbi:hypothetical protein [Brevibacillus fulvus]|uniref:Uncharacterized protein n=1 Tax=Brevibacillus fulvus TaxID=1125967 RepID=A0A938XUQ8_9BACL|nr:hypothetical protein [Brevibacillus fulvus]MBM7588444.1 hypothetical protein [Brevibacillus fulvus]